MKKSKFIKFFRKIHKWPAIIIALFALLFALSGIILNHRQQFSSVDISRKILPPNYNYKNWNMASVRGSLNVNSDTSFVYGNIGIWETTDDFRTFNDINHGFPLGIDNRKIYSVILFKNDLLVAGTHFGLYKSYNKNIFWEKITLPTINERITDLTIKDDTLIILTRDNLLKSTDLLHFEKINLPQPVNYKRETGLFNTLWELHSGELFGMAGQLFTDLLGIVTILLSVTGLLHFFFPKIIRRRKRREKAVMVLTVTKRKNLRWHNVFGYIFVLFLVLNTIAGIFLRPPLLIAIANSKVGILPYTHLDTPNPWFDKLRRVIWDENIQKYIFSTSEGFYYSDEALNNPLNPFIKQPPVSVMGCNVFKKVNEVEYLVGSFSGMFLWNIHNGEVSDYFSNQPYIKPEGMSRPISDHMVAGLIEKFNGEQIWFDYNKGAERLTSLEEMSNLNFPEMPEEIVTDSPMSLWNTALEFHTGRIFEHLIGPFYILYVPLSGLCLIAVLISGFFLWWMVFRKRT